MPTRVKRYFAPDPALPGFGVRVLPSGTKTYAAVARDPSGKQIWATIGSTALFTLEEGRGRARAAMQAIRDGKDHKSAAMFDEVADQWLAKKAKKLRPRSLQQYQHAVNRMRQAWKGRTFGSIGRSDLKRLIDKTEDNIGERAPHYLVQTFRPMAKYYGMSHEDYIVPVVPGMAAYSPQKAARDRILTDIELVALWENTASLIPYHPLLRLLLLTAQREHKLATLRWADIDGIGVWTVRTEAGEKGNVGQVRLPPIALSIIRRQPRLASDPHVFAGRRDGPFSNWSTAKKKFDAELKIEPWKLHDLRRTARLVWEHWLDNAPFVVTDFIAHDSQLPFWSLNHG